MTYLLLNLAFFAVLLIAGWILLKKDFKKPNQKALLLTIIAVLTATAIFDPLIILFNIVNYNPSTLVGLYIWLAPVEDFAYAIVAAVGAPILWHNLKTQPKGETNG